MKPTQPMEHIILDTNIFLKENFLEGKRIRELFKLSEQEKIKIVLTKITIEEVKNNFKKLSSQALTNLAVFRKPFESRVLRNNSVGKHLYDKIDKKNVADEFNHDFDEIISKSKVVIIDYSEINIKSVFDSYFKNEYPFNGADKKSEFPDAFALALIEKWSIENGIQCTIFSSDKDFLNFKSKHLKITKDYEIYLDEKLQYYLTQEHRISILKDLFEKNSQRIDEEIKEWYQYKLDDESLYYNVVWFDIHGIDITEVVITGKTYQIVSIDEESIEIEIEANVTFKVELVIDDEDYSHYDNEDKVTYFFETRVEEIERNVTASLSVLAYIINKEEYDDQLEILEINKDENLVINEEYEDYR